MLKFTMTAASILALAACGSGNNDDENGNSMLPASVVTAAMLEPGTLQAYDGDDVKTMLEGAGDDFADHSAADDNRDAGNDKCFNDKMNELKFEAKGAEMRLSGEVDLSSCQLTIYQEDARFKDADFTDFVSVYKIKVSSYISCSGQDLSKYNGKTFVEVADVSECNTDGTSVTIRSETTTSSSLKATIKNVELNGAKVIYTVDEESTDASVTRMANGNPCTATVTGATVRWADGCSDISRNVTTKGKRGYQGSEAQDENIGKAEYERYEYVGLKGAANVTSLWYTAGQMNVTLNDWTGIVRYSSATAEPIFEMKKGTETVTGTIKAPTIDAKALMLKVVGLR